MATMTPFQYIEFYDVPRCIALLYRDKVFLLQSAFDENLDDYPSSYSIYVLSDSVRDFLGRGSWEFLRNTQATYVGQIRIDHVVFDPTKRKEIDAAILDSFLSNQEQIK